MSNIMDLIGMNILNHTFEVEKVKIKEFVEAIGDENPVYTDGIISKTSGLITIPIPLTFLTSSEFWGVQNIVEILAKYGVNPYRIVHGEQAYEYLGEIFAGDVLSISTKVVDVNIKSGSSGKMDIIKMRSEYINQNNERVAVSESVVIHRH